MSTRSYNYLDIVVGDTTLPLFFGTGSPTSGVSGTFAGVAIKGALLITDEAALYQNRGTLASPTWGQPDSGVVAITGGTIDGVTIGGTTPGAVTTNAFHLDTGTKTAAATAGAATLNKMSGKITSEALTTAGLADYTLTLTNTNIAAADIVLASVGNGTNTQGTIAVGSVVAAAGSATIAVHNLHATQALNGTIVISFAVLKN